MPHLTVYATEEQLIGREPALISALTDTVAQIYGEWARELVVVQLLALPAGRWGVGGRAADNPSPIVSFGIREIALTRPDGPQIVERLATEVTDVVARVLGDELRAGVLVEFRSQDDDRTALGGRLVGALERPADSSTQTNA
jgi:phenylpyruvate tautomerase PptA (4-oxalocrotonate tautomerase family)